jgi:hypothetical protein
LHLEANESKRCQETLIIYEWSRAAVTYQDYYPFSTFTDEVYMALNQHVFVMAAFEHLSENLVSWSRF